MTKGNGHDPVQAEILEVLKNISVKTDRALALAESAVSIAGRSLVIAERSLVIAERSLLASDNVLAIATHTDKNVSKIARFFLKERASTSGRLDAVEARLAALETSSK